ncbi:cytochrome c biogenesis protein ResB [Alkalicoccus daliensis]|uniref:Cytochrome c biogenesis protein n=1 Tax=Alkalicoccus daliensis TaxID=745820 RepID=A0A1H0AY48_9BACI|nr:cytochrome c biogenesis protein ResB [Alkalicoccus daliensis]SDN38372.1 cytochrome c biogenesis protein [Alkalicoccus daliensis]
MNKVTCECGHKNPYGTYLCESCGKPLKDEGKLANMRYEGVARRSQTYQKSIVDKIWNFFSSVKVGIWIIVLLLVTSSLGTLFPQEMYIPPGEDPSLYYAQEYGILGQLYYDLGFHNLYSSWWYMLLIAALGISLVIASLDRFVPLYRALKNQRVTRHTAFMKKQRVYGMKENSEALDIKALSTSLKERKYNVREEDGNLLAEKGRFARWGPYVNHIGLIIFLIGGMLRFFPGMYLDDYVWIREGETEVISGTEGEYFVQNNQFLVELYDEEDNEIFQEALMREGSPVVSNYQTDATLFKRSTEGSIGSETELEKVKDHSIRVNEPLTFEGISLYQVDYRLNELSTFTFGVEIEEDGEVQALEEVVFEVDLNDPQMYYEFDNGYQIEIIEYFPNFNIDESGEPTTLNRVPDNPRIIFELYPPDADPEEDTGEISLIGVQVNEPLNEDHDHTLRMLDVEFVDVTGLTIRRDHTLPIIIAGGIIFMIGLTQGSYWFHRRIWIQQKDGQLYVAGHANKNWHALKRDIEYLREKHDLPETVDQADEEVKEKDQVNEGGRDKNV